MKRMAWASLGTVGLLMATSSVAFAQDEPADEMVDEVEPAAEPEAEEPVAEEPEAEESPAEEAPEEESKKGLSSKEGGDGMRFRFGVQAGAGPMIGNQKDLAESINFTYAGSDLRFGLQVNNLVGVYVQPQMGVYWTGGGSGIFGTGGLIGASLGADFTFLNRLFVGAGFGYAVLNNPAGPELHFRLGGYPLMGRSKEKVRRKGLMLGADLRLHFVKGGYTFVAPTFSIGYEAF